MHLGYGEVPAAVAARSEKSEKGNLPVSMKPVEIYDVLSQSVIGQEESLRYVSVAIFKHLEGEKFGNLLLIGNSGTGKTTIMRGIERLYNAHEEFAEYRVVLIMNANTLARRERSIPAGFSPAWRSAPDRCWAKAPPPSRSAAPWSGPPSAWTRSTRSRG